MTKELTLRVTDLEKKAIAFCREKDVPFPIANYLVDFANEAIKELEKENAELKSENQKWKDEWQEQVQKATDEGYARTLQNIQLSKAKELIQTFLGFAEAFGYSPSIDKFVTDAEQFISEVEK